MMRTVLIIIAMPLLALVATASDIGDNCCHIAGRNCQTGNDWVQGYYDGVHGRCQTTAAALSDTTPQSTPTPAPAQTADSSQNGNNCCYNGWQCASGADWTNGYYARQAGDACTAESQASYQHQSRAQSNNPPARSQNAGAAGQSDEDEQQSLNDWFKETSNLCETQPDQCSEAFDERLDDLRENCEEIEGYTCQRGQGDGFVLLGPPPSES